MTNLVVAAIVATVVAGLVARWPRTVPRVDTRWLRIRGADGGIHAQLIGDSLILGSGLQTAILGRDSLTFRGPATLLVEDPDHVPDDEEESESESVDRVVMGIDQDGSAALRFYGAWTQDRRPTGAVSEVMVTREGRHRLRVGQMWPRPTLLEDGATLVIRPGAMRIKIVGREDALLWEWPGEPADPAPAEG